MVMASWTLDTRTSDNKKRKTFRSRRLVCGDHTQLKIRLCPAVDNHRRLPHTVLHRVVGSFFHRLPEPRTRVASWRHATRPCEDPGPPLERSGTVGSSLVQSETDWKCALPHFHPVTLSDSQLLQNDCEIRRKQNPPTTQSGCQEQKQHHIGIWVVVLDEACEKLSVASEKVLCFCVGKELTYSHHSEGASCLVHLLAAV